MLMFFRPALVECCCRWYRARRDLHRKYPAAPSSPISMLTRVFLRRGRQFPPKTEEGGAQIPGPSSVEAMFLYNHYDPGRAHFKTVKGYDRQPANAENRRRQGRPRRRGRRFHAGPRPGANRTHVNDRHRQNLWPSARRMTACCGCLSESAAPLPNSVSAEGD